MLIYDIVFKFYVFIICADVACQNRMGSTTVRRNGSIFELLRIKTFCYVMKFFKEVATALLVPNNSKHLIFYDK
jgi:hypothetical protein